MIKLAHCRFERALAKIARISLRPLDREQPEGRLTRSGHRQLERLDKDGLRLALAALAFDVKQTTAKFLDLHTRGEAEEADLELAALRGRILGGWAYEHVVGFSIGRIQGGHRNVADPLGIGLGEELWSWLIPSEPVDMAAAKQWLATHGPALQAFDEYVKERNARSR